MSESIAGTAEELRGVRAMHDAIDNMNPKPGESWDDWNARKDLDASIRRGERAGRDGTVVVGLGTVAVPESTVISVGGQDSVSSDATPNRTDSVVVAGSRPITVGPTFHDAADRAH